MKRFGDLLKGAVIAKGILILTVFAVLAGTCSKTDKYHSLQKELTEFVSGKDARIGIAVIIDQNDTVTVNGNEAFPMLSVYKFPIALALAEDYRLNNLSFEQPVRIYKEDLHLDTYSPMTEKILASSKMITDSLHMTTRELLTYMLQQSDNNASDIILKKTGGAQAIDHYLAGIGADGINVKNSEDEMHIDQSLCYCNSATPLAMASLMDKFDREYNDPLSVEIKQIMESCSTGTNRLAKPLLETDAAIGHKTGTGFILSDGRLMAVNDAGYVHLPDGHRYSIAVFIENSGYDMTETEALIATISEKVYSFVTNNIQSYGSHTINFCEISRVIAVWHQFVRLDKKLCCVQHAIRFWYK